MPYSYFNPNPAGRKVGDCAIRAVSKALSVDWQTAYAMVTSNGFIMGDMPSADSVWGATLQQSGFRKAVIPDTCPECYTAGEFADDHQHGIYVLAFGGHVATVVDGELFDSWDSSSEIPVYFWYKEE